MNSTLTLKLDCKHSTELESVQEALTSSTKAGTIRKIIMSWRSLSNRYAELQLCHQMLRTEHNELKKQVATMLDAERRLTEQRETVKNLVK